MLGVHIVVMITDFDLSQEILAIHVFTDLKSSSKYRRKRTQRLLRLYGDQALDEKSIFFSLRCYWCPIVIEHLIQIPKQGYLCSD